MASIPTSVFPTQIAFHAYDPHMAVTNEQDLILYVVYRVPQLCIRLTCFLQRLRLAAQEKSFSVLQRKPSRQ